VTRVGGRARAGSGWDSRCHVRGAQPERGEVLGVYVTAEGSL